MKKTLNLFIAFVFSIAIIFTTLSNVNLTANAASSVGTPYLTFSNITSSSITINWNKTTGGVTYELYACSSESGLNYTSPIATLGGSSTGSYSYTHSGLYSNTTYYYKVKACGTSGSATSPVYSKKTAVASSGSGSSTTTTNNVVAPALTFSNITSSSITINWNKTNGGASYELYGCDSESGVNYRLLATLGGSSTGSYSYTHSGLYSNTTYYYKVKACGTSGSATSAVYQKKTAVASSSSSTTTTNNVVAPTLSFSNITSSSITINWNKTTGGTYYELYGCDSQSGIDYNLLTTLGGSSTGSYSYTHSGLYSNTTYYYKIKACNGNGHSGTSTVYSRATISPLATPTLTYTNVTNSSITLHWSGISGAEYYELYGCSSESGLEYNLIYTIGGGSSFSYTHSDLISGTTYYYMLKAYDGDGNAGSSTSRTYSVATKNALNAPTLSFSDITPTSITVNWDAVKGAEYYELYGCSSESGLDYSLIYTIGGGSSFSYVHSDLFSTTTYYYMIKAFDGDGSSSSGASLVYSSATIAPLATPTLAFSNITSSSITINWSSVSGAEYYELYGSSSESDLEYNLIHSTGGDSSYSYKHSDLTYGTTYYYMLKAYDGNGNAGSSTSLTYSTSTKNSLAAPTLILYDITLTSISINWNVIEDADYYELYSCDSISGLEYNMIYTTSDDSSCTYTHSNLLGETTYYYMLKAYDSDGNLGTGTSLVYSAKTSDPVTAPNLSFPNNSESLITISWNATNATRYELYGSDSESGLEYNLLCELESDGSSVYHYIHNDLYYNTTYYYMIKAYDKNGKSVLSPVYSKKTGNLTTSTDLSLSFSDITDSSVTISWNKLNDAEYYYLSRCTADGVLEDIGLYRTPQNGTTSYTHTNLDSDTTYYYVVKAYDAQGNVTMSPVCSTKTNKALTVHFSDITDSSITINWDSAVGVYYELYYYTNEGALQEHYLFTDGGRSTYSYTHKDLTPDTTYYYIIRICDGRGNETYTPIYSQSTKPIDTAPTLVFSDITPVSITINWDKTSNGLYYELYNCTSDGVIEGDYIYTMGGQQTYSFTHTDLKSDTIYYYKLLEYTSGSNYVASETYFAWTNGDMIYWYNYDANGGTGAPDSQHATQNDALTITDQIPTRFGYNFKGWQVSGTDTVYYPGDVIPRVTSDATLVAVWEETQLYTDDTVFDSYDYHPYYIEDTDYSSNGVCINEDVDGLHYFRICSSTEELVVTLTMPHDQFISDSDVTLTAYPEQFEAYTAAKFTETNGITVELLDSDSKFEDTHYVKILKYKTNNIYNGDSYYDFGLCIDVSHLQIYDCNIKYTYPKDVVVTNGGYWASDWYKDEEAMTGGAVIVNQYVVNDITHTYTAQQMGMANYWYLTPEQKEQWQKICNYIYDKEVINACRIAAASELTVEMVETLCDFAFDKFVMDSFRAPDIIVKFTEVVDKYFPDLDTSQQAAMILSDFFILPEEEYIEIYGIDFYYICHQILDQLTTFAYDPYTTINAIEQDLYDASLNGTLPTKLAELSGYIDNNSLFSKYAYKIYCKESFDTLKEEIGSMIQDAILSEENIEKVIKKGLLSSGIISAAKAIVVEYKIIKAIYEFEQAMSWCETAEAFRETIDTFCSYINGGVKTNALSATYFVEYQKSIAWAVGQEAPIDLCVWNGTPIPRHIHYDIIGDVVAFEEI